MSHPAKIAKLQSQRKLQYIARTEKASRCLELNTKLMHSFSNDVNEIYKILNKVKGKASNKDIPFLETLNGTYYGENILEGFRANTQTLCSNNNTWDSSKDSLFELCRKDNTVILDLDDKDDIKVPPLSLEGLKNILFKKLKINKACDIYKLTVEHLRYSGDQTFELLVQIINLILCHLNYLSSNQLNTSIASIVHKGKDKPVFVHKSYIQVRVTPLIARIID